MANLGARLDRIEAQVDERTFVRVARAPTSAVTPPAADRSANVPPDNTVRGGGLNLRMRLVAVCMSED